MKILVAFGTRPEIIKLAPVIHELKRCKHNVEIFNSGQHSDLVVGLLEFFNIDVTYSANIVVAQEMSAKYSLALNSMQRIIGDNDYEWIIVQGDTLTAAAAAQIGFFNRVKVAHVEAGLRTDDFNSPFPEEWNRRVITLCSTLHFAPTALSSSNLAKEGVSPSQIRQVGNTAVDALKIAITKITPSQYKEKLILATLHRRENIGPKLNNILLALRDLARDGDKEIVLPVHANPNVARQVRLTLGNVPNVTLTDPLSYVDLVSLLSHAWIVVSDSGGLQEETPSFGIPIVITRDTTERPEVLEKFGVLAGHDRSFIRDFVRDKTKGKKPHIANINPFGDGKSSVYIVRSMEEYNEKITVNKFEIQERAVA